MQKRRIKSIDVKFLSLVDRGANKMGCLYRSTDNTVEVQTLFRMSENFDELGELTCVAYVPEFRDSHGDIADATVVKEMLYTHQKNGAQVDIMHNMKPVSKDEAFVAENFLIQAGDQRFSGWTDLSGKTVNLVGSWASIIKILSPELRKKYRSGEFTGVSLCGLAEVELEKQEELDMDPKELAAELAKLLKPAEPVDQAELLKVALLKMLQPAEDLPSLLRKALGLEQAASATPANKATALREKVLEMRVEKLLAEAAETEDPEVYEECMAKVDQLFQTGPKQKKPASSVVHKSAQKYKSGSGYLMKDEADQMQNINELLQLAEEEEN